MFPQSLRFDFYMPYTPFGKKFLNGVFCLDKSEKMLYNKVLLKSLTVQSHLIVILCEKRTLDMEKTSFKTIAENRKARHEYFILDSYEAGIELVGTEVKSIRQGGINLKDSWCSIDDGELWVKGMHISPYDHGNIFNRDPMRVRKLLLHKKQIMQLLGKVKQEGLTLIPISVYFKGSMVKVQVGLCKGKKLHDKRDDMAAKAAQRDIERAVKERNH